MKRFTQHLALWTAAAIAIYIYADRGTIVHEFFINAEFIIVLLLLVMSATTANFTITPVAPSPVAPVLTKEDVAAIVAAALVAHNKVEAREESVVAPIPPTAQELLEVEVREELEAEELEAMYEKAQQIIDAREAKKRAALKAKIRKQMIREIEKELS